MPKRRHLLIASFALAALAACGPNEGQAPSPAASSPPPAPAPPSLAPVDPTASPTPEPPETRAPGETRPSSEPDPGQCGADKLDEFINVLPSSDIMEKIREQVGDRRIRTVGPNDVITMDFSPERLNIETGEDGRIKRFRCY